MSQCKVCQKPIAEQAKTGRPKDYCSVSCRRKIECQLKRVKNRVLKLKAKLIQPGADHNPASSRKGRGARV